MNDEPFPPLIEQLPLGVYRSTLDGRQLRANAALVRLNGYGSEAELLAAVRDIGREWYVLPSRRDEFARILERDGQIHDFVSEIYRHKTRERIWVRETAHLVRDAASRPLWYEGTVQDVTAEQTARQALVAQERRFRALTDRAQVLTLVSDPSSRILYASQAMRAVLGRDPAAVVGVEILDLIHPDDLAEARVAFFEVVERRNAGTESLFRMAHADGSWRTIAALGQNCLDDEAVAGIVLNYRDVTERERAQQEVLQSQQRFRSAFAASPDAMILSRLADGCYLEVNDTFVQLSGYTREDLIGRTSLELNIWEDAASRAAFVAEFQRSGHVRHFVAPYRGRGGRRGVVDISAEIVDVDGERCVLAISRDITQELAARRSLEESEARLRIALRAGKQGLWELDIDAGTLMVSAEYATLLGHDPDRFVETAASFFAALHPDDVGAVRQAIADYLEGRCDEYQVEYRQRHRGGRWVWLLATGRKPDPAEPGRPRRVVGTIRDITRRREAEIALRALADDLERLVAERTRQLADSERRYRSIFEMVPVAIVEEDWTAALALLEPHRAQAAADPAAWVRDHPDLVASCARALRVVRLNPAAAELYGFDAGTGEALVPAAHFRLFETVDGFAEQLSTLLAGRRRHDQLRQVRRADGTLRDVQVAMVPPAPDDGLALFGMLDVTDLKRLTSELDASLAEARRAHRELETFTYSVSHDLKTPLRGLDGYSHLLLSRYGESLDAEGREFLIAIRTAVRHMAQLTDDLLAYAKLERSPQSLQVVALAELVRSVLDDGHAALHKRGIEPALALSDIAVLADRSGLKLVLRNLVDNAVKFTAAAERPSLAIAAERTDSGRVRISVRDNGVGFDMAFHDRVFQIFQRLHRAEDYPGTGVGLAMVAKAMERMGGRVWAESAPGEGACFYLELPAA